MALNRIPSVITCALLVPLIACSSIEPVGEVPRAAPWSNIVMIDGNVDTVKRLSSNKPLVLTFWATWCPHSKPYVVKLNEFAKSRPDARFVALSVNTNEEYDELQAFIKEKQLESIEHSFSGNDYYDEAYIRFGISSIPHTFVINKQQTIVLETASISDIEEVLDSL